MADLLRKKMKIFAKKQPYFFVIQEIITIFAPVKKQPQGSVISTSLRL